MKFIMFYLAEYMNQLMISALFAVLFLGGWRGPWVDQVPVLGTLWLMIKTIIAMLVIQFFQYSLPRLRIDQILNLNWKFLTPLALVNVCVLALVGKAVPAGAGPWVRTGTFLVANVLMALVVAVLVAVAGRRARRRAEARAAASG
jgi:NADH-quinone oxidoreductase subunit H